MRCVGAQEFNKKMREAFKAEDLAEFAIQGEDERFAEAVGKGGPAAGALVTVKAAGGGGDNKRKAPELAATLYQKKKKGQGGGRGGDKRQTFARK